MKGLFPRVSKLLEKVNDRVLMACVGVVTFLEASGFSKLAYAADGGSELTELIQKVGLLIKYIALIVGWGLGFLFVVSGIMDLMKKSDDPRAAGRGAAKLAGGVGLVAASMLIYWILAHFNLAGEHTFTPPSY